MSKNQLEIVDSIGSVLKRMYKISLLIFILDMSLKSGVSFICN